MFKTLKLHKVLKLSYDNNEKHQATKDEKEWLCI